MWIDETFSKLPRGRNLSILPVHQLRTYIHLLEKVDIKTGCAEMVVSEFARLLGCHRRTIYKAIQALESKELILRVKGTGEGTSRAQVGHSITVQFQHLNPHRGSSRAQVGHSEGTTPIIDIREDKEPPISPKGDERKKRAKKKKTKTHRDAWKSEYSERDTGLIERLAKKFMDVTEKRCQPGTMADHYGRLVLQDGWSPQHMVVVMCAFADKWKNHEQMDSALTPLALFRPTKFKGKVDEAISMGYTDPDDKQKSRAAVISQATRSQEPEGPGRISSLATGAGHQGLSGDGREPGPEDGVPRDEQARGDATARKVLPPRDLQASQGRDRQALSAGKLHGEAVAIGNVLARLH